jgi:hypothetical protein
MGIVEFCDRDDCVLSIALMAAPRRIVLSGGVIIDRGDVVIALHFWNEHLGRLRGRGLARAVGLSHRLNQSLRDLAMAVAIDPHLRQAKAVTATLASGWRHRPRAVDRFAAHFGFELVEGKANGLRRVRDLIDDLWLWGLAWAFCPQTLAYRNIVRRRADLWISRANFIERYTAT